MKVIFLKSFLSDIKKVKDKGLKSRIKKLILEIEAAKSLEEITGVKKMRGYSIAYRIRMGDYRLGLYKEADCVELARFLKRNDIYKVFPK
ncbi:MAG: plasmid stabilization protein [Arenibacter troitsensis]|nr:plasmid stabilization protein [Arenibacter troitsensis]|tara:strand:+ start:249 stop:518 length:270 start_codon:yes stop_codon:yes gene_type:complete